MRYYNCYMATINDFKAIRSRSIRHYDLAKPIIDPFSIKDSVLSDTEKARFGFYYLAVQALISIADYDDITDGIVDSDFNSTFFDLRQSDEGIDAIFIEQEGKRISLFNFKFREKFDVNKEQSLNETVLSSKYLGILKTMNNTLPDGKLKDKTDDILECLNSNDEWSIDFFIVSNENHALEIDNRNLVQLSDIFGVSIHPIDLNNLVSLVFERPESINTTVILSPEALMSYSENPLDSRKSYIIRLSLVELIRMTSSDKSLRENPSIEDNSLIASSKIEMGVMYDNIRGYLTRSGFNKNIERTLKDSPSKFFFYNNGITIVADSIQVTQINANSRYKLEITGLQVLNGGQTLRTIHIFNQEDPSNLTQYLSHANVLVRVLNVTDVSEKNLIGEYTNSQNSISLVDLRSTRPEQLNLENYLADHGILYIRKRGNTGDCSKNYSISVTMSRMGQILLAAKGRPDLISNKKSEIFDSQYDALFGGQDLLSQTTIDLINMFVEISDSYRESGFKPSDQKKLYVLYLANISGRRDYVSIINEFEPMIDTFISERKLKLSPARVLIRAEFKNWLDEQIGVFAHFGEE